MTKSKSALSRPLSVILILIGTIIAGSIGYAIADYLISEDRKVAELEVENLFINSEEKRAYGILSDTQVGGGCSDSRYRFYSGGFEVLSIYRPSVLSEFIVTRTYPAYIDFNKPCGQMRVDPNKLAESMLTAFMTVPIERDAMVASLIGPGSNLPLTGREVPEAYSVIKNLPSYKSDYHEYVLQRGESENGTQEYTYRGKMGMATIKSENQTYRMEQIDNKVLITRLSSIVISGVLFLGIVFGTRATLRRKPKL